MNSDDFRYNQNDKINSFRGNENPCREIESDPLRLPTGSDLVKAVFIIFAVEFVLGFALQSYLGGEFKDTPPEFMLTIVLVSNISAFCVSWYFLCAKYEISFRDGFALKKINFKTIILSVAFGVLAACVAVALMLLFSTGESEMARILSSPEGFIAVAILMLVVPFFEEVYYRGFIFVVIKKYTGGIGAIIIVTTWFGFLHVFQLSGDPIGIVVIFIVGAILTIERYILKSLFPSIITHLVYNFSLLLLSFIE